MSVDNKGLLSHLAELRDRLDEYALPALCYPAPKDTKQDIDLIDESPLASIMESADDADRWWRLLEDAAASDSGCDAAVGSLVGLALADAAGAPLEFSVVDPQEAGSGRSLYKKAERPCLLQELREGKLHYENSKNCFKLMPGQWTDDTSMALCLADSLLLRKKYHGGDARVRWHMWWYHGYCNAFRHDLDRAWRGSVGLGGNIALSLRGIEGHAVDSEDAAEAVPPIYASKTNDSGNGSIMRVAPVPIAFHLFAEQAMEVAALQSWATHPGNDAAACCRFVAFFIAQAISTRKSGLTPAADCQSFVSGVIQDFLGRADMKTDGMKKLEALLLCKPPSPKEQHWDWQRDVLAITETLYERWRGKLYNGHPVLPAYFGAYCMDGLAMALWAIWHSTDFSSSVLRAVNLLGDADTVGAVAGQMAGVLYGFTGIVAGEWGRASVANLRNWDPCAEVGLRAALLYHYDPYPGLIIKSGEDGARSAKILATADCDADVVGEIPLGEHVSCTAQSGSFFRVKWQDVNGWIDARSASPLPVVGAELMAGQQDSLKNAKQHEQEAQPSIAEKVAAIVQPIRLQMRADREAGLAGEERRARLAQWRSEWTASAKDEELRSLVCRFLTVAENWYLSDVDASAGAPKCNVECKTSDHSSASEQSIPEEILKVLNVMGPDSERPLASSELTQLLGKLGFSFSTQQLNQVITVLDKAGEGKVSLKEFITWVFKDARKV